MGTLNKSTLIDRNVRGFDSVVVKMLNERTERYVSLFNPVSTVIEPFSYGDRYTKLDISIVQASNEYIIYNNNSKERQRAKTCVLEETMSANVRKLFNVLVHIYFTRC